MEVSCSFKTLVAGDCGFDPKDRKRETTIIPLLAWKKAILDRKAAFEFSGPETEVDLIFSQAAIFDIQAAIYDKCSNETKLGRASGWGNN